MTVSLIIEDATYYGKTPATQVLCAGRSVLTAQDSLFEKSTTLTKCQTPNRSVRRVVCGDSRESKSVSVPAPVGTVQRSRAEIRAYPSKAKQEMRLKEWPPVDQTSLAYARSLIDSSISHVGSRIHLLARIGRKAHVKRRVCGISFGGLGAFCEPSSYWRRVRRHYRMSAEGLIVTVTTGHRGHVWASVCVVVCACWARASIQSERPRGRVKEPTLRHPGPKTKSMSLAGRLVRGLQTQP
ncbi:uncharacterized protein CCOS01_09351 [Colletotrichum costaricense]|uniref:Uncharacterized protein n=1 Tax=Colletotrichum costaricense TaxID=1209916 RepID=A0AAJ0DYX3_9PEZI|nr:uncharacterized protein CCOS01_09351 [Colletotrichum costaricense]KAK1524264.1 hypothetical protein CCOS01_09351 [Colletotrichum costaricense]